ncbi:MAG: hypothetical protein WBV82_32925 [Myxococcaceae bacterium]
MKLFLPQTTLEEWALEDRADLQDGKLVVPSEQGAWPVTPAVHFVKLVSGEDGNKLVARVKTEGQLSDLGAEHMADSVLIGETAYEVVPGYLTEVAPPKPAIPRASSMEETSSADLLAQFLLNKL